MPLSQIAIFFLVTLAIGGLGWVFAYPILSGERKAEQRRMLVAQPDGPVRKATAGRPQPKLRREQVEETLKEIEEKGKKLRRPPLSVRIQQAGLSWSKRNFYLVSAGMGIVALIAMFVVSGGLLMSPATGFAATFGLPHWLLAFLKKRREDKFIENFADAVDVIVRGIKAGLPLHDSIKVLSVDSPEPIRSEFRTIVDTQAIGMPIGEACLRLFDRIPLAEANFFGIVIAIQQKAGGNLSEALGNPLEGVARPQKDEGQDLSYVDRGESVRRHHRRLPTGRDAVRLSSQPKLHSLLWTNPTGHDDARLQRGVDDDRHLRHEKDDQFRFLSLSYG